MQSGGGEGGVVLLELEHDRADAGRQPAHDDGREPQIMQAHGGKVQVNATINCCV